jgi:hypothetical protein
MPALVSRLVRTLFRREALPTRVLWWFAAEGTCEWVHLLRRELALPLGGTAAAESVLQAIVGRMLRRRYEALRALFSHLPDPEHEPRAVGLVMGALYRVASNPGEAWMFARVGGAPATFAEHARAEAIIEPIPIRARWEEISHHLGELLIVATEDLPAVMPRANVTLGDICFFAGVHFGKKMKKAMALGDSPDEALEMLRMAEYVFRVNPEHWSKTDPGARRGYLEGTACPWFDRPGWSGAHCGIFGQFQSGITSVSGLRYQLTQTIPKHGGHTCRIDVRPVDAAPIALRRSRDTFADRGAS